MIFFDMNFFVDERSTKKEILLLLKKSGGMSIDELSKIIPVTPMGIRQHLITLEKKGLVGYAPIKKGVGRPGFVYKLNEAAEELFPQTYDNLALGILKDIRKHDGNEKIGKIFDWRRERIFNESKEALTGKETVGEKLDALKGFLENEGHLVEISNGTDHYNLKQYHCPIKKVAAEFEEACSSELRLYRDLLGKDVKRTQTVSEGADACLYVIPGKPNN